MGLLRAARGQEEGMIESPVTTGTILGRRVTRELSALVARRGRPGMLVSDSGTEFTSTAILDWEEEHRIAWQVAPASSPADSLN